MIWKRLFYISAALTLIFLAGTVFLYMSADTSKDTAFEPTGTTSSDVLRALVHLGELEALPGDATTAPARQAIKRAEREFGLLADGFPDKTLLDQLIARIEAKRHEQSTIGGWTLQKMSLLVTTIGGIVTLVLQLLTFRRDAAKA